MIREWLEARWTPAPGPLRKLGYVDEVVAIGARHRRQHAAWAGHLAQTRAFVADAAGAGDHLVVLGSGRLLDLPLDVLAPRFERVTLVDCVHPRAARRAAAAWPHVSFLTADVTDCAARLALQRPDEPLPVPGPPRCLDTLPPPTCTISLNLLSQLPIMPLQWLARRGVPEVSREAFGAALVRAHVDFMAALPGRRVLVSDVRRRWRAVGGAACPAGALLAEDDAVEIEDALHGVRLPPPDATWRWAVAPAGEIAPDVALDLDVQAYRDLGGFGPPAP